MAAALATGADAAFLGDEAVEALFGGERLLVHAGAGHPARRGGAHRRRLPAERRVARSPPGVKHAQILHTAALVEDTGEVADLRVPESSRRR